MNRGEAGWVPPALEPGVAAAATGRLRDDAERRPAQGRRRSGPGSTRPGSNASRTTSRGSTSTRAASPGCQVAVARHGHGRLLPVVRRDGPRARDAGPRRHHLAHLLDDETDHGRRADVAVRARSVPAHGSGCAVHPGVADLKVREIDGRWCQAARRAAPADDGTRRDDAHDRLRVGRTQHAVRSRDRPRPRPASTFATASSNPLDADWTLETLVERLGRAYRCASIPASTGSTRCRPTCARDSSRSSRDSASTTTSTKTIFAPLGMSDTGFVGPGRRDRPLRRAATDAARDKSLRLVDDPLESGYRKTRTFLSGGGGLVVDHRRLPALRADALQRRRARRRPHPRPQDGRAHDRGTTCPAAASCASSRCRAATARSASTAPGSA